MAQDTDLVQHTKQLQHAQKPPARARTLHPSPHCAKQSLHSGLVAKHPLLLLLSQGKDFAPRQHLKHAQQAQRARTNARSPPQVSRKRKAQQETHPTASTGLHLTAGSGPSCHDTPLQAGQASRHNRLKSLGSRPKQARSAEAAKSMAVDVTAPQHSQQQSCKVLDAQQGVVSLPLPASTLQAQVSGVPHTQLVLNTMQQLSRTLSSEPRASPSTQGLFQPSILAPGTGTAAAAAPPNAESAAVEQSAASAAAAQVSTQFPQPPPRQQHSAQQSLSPVLQPFLVPAADREQTCQSTPLLDADSLQAVQTSANKAPFAHGDHSLVQPNDQQVGVGQAEGQSSEPADGLPQNLKASGFEQKEAGPMTHMQTGSALQQLISRAQKLKQQLDAHAARRHDRRVMLLSARSQCAQAVCHLPACSIICTGCLNHFKQCSIHGMYR